MIDNAARRLLVTVDSLVLAAGAGDVRSVPGAGFGLQPRVVGLEGAPALGRARQADDVDGARYAWTWDGQVRQSISFWAR